MRDPEGEQRPDDRKRQRDADDEWVEPTAEEDDEHHDDGDDREDEGDAEILEGRHHVRRRPAEFQADPARQNLARLDRNAVIGVTERQARREIGRDLDGTSSTDVLDRRERRAVEAAGSRDIDESRYLLKAVLEVPADRPKSIEIVADQCELQRFGGVGTDERHVADRGRDPVEWREVRADRVFGVDRSTVAVGTQVYVDRADVRLPLPRADRGVQGADVRIGANRAFEFARGPNRFVEAGPERRLKTHDELAAIEVRDETLREDRDQREPRAERGQRDDHDDHAMT